MCGYAPVRIDARLGQQSELVVNAREKFTPCSTSDPCTSGIAHSVSHRWSSVTISRIEGGSVGSSCAAADGARDTERARAARQADASRRAFLLSENGSETEEANGEAPAPCIARGAYPLAVRGEETGCRVTTVPGSQASYDR